MVSRPSISNVSYIIKKHFFKMRSPRQDHQSIRLSQALHQWQCPIKNMTLFDKIIAHLTIFTNVSLLNYYFIYNIISLPLPSSLTYFVVAYFIVGVTADFIIGLVHWAADHYGTMDTKFFGKYINFFRMHHLKPIVLTENSIIYNICDVPLTALCFACYFVDQTTPDFLNISLFYLFLFIIMSLVNHR